MYYFLVDYSCGAESKCDGYEEREESTDDRE